jgi:hypothetical protein
MLARHPARNNPQLISATSGVMPNFAGVEKVFSRMTFKASGAAILVASNSPRAKS